MGKKAGHHCLLEKRHYKAGIALPSEYNPAMTFGLLLKVQEKMPKSKSTTTMTDTDACSWHSGKLNNSEESLVLQAD